jgi:hypothetical protein
VHDMVWGCLRNGCSDDREMYGLPVGASEKGEMHLAWMQVFPSPFNALFTFLSCCFLLSRE